MSVADARREPARPAAPAGWRALIAPGLASLVALAILISLGLWQLERKAWKEGLIAQITARAYGEPGVPIQEPNWPTWRAAEDEFRRVRLAGRFLHDREVQVHGLMAAQRGSPVQGFYVFTPLEQADGSVVIVNRGFVPTELRRPSTRALAQPAGVIEVVGLIRAPEQRGSFVPPNDPSKDEWFVRDLGEMARARDLNRVAPFYVDADATPNPGGWPRGGQTRLTLPNDHLQYALTWFGLALTLVGVFGTWAGTRLRPTRTVTS